MSIGLLQLISKSYQDEILTSNPNITYFKYVYKTQPLFFKQDREVKNIKVNWDSEYSFNIKNDIHLLENIFLKIKIPFFKFIKNNTEINNIIVKNKEISKLLFDSYDTYLYFFDNNIYLIPSFLYNNNFSDYELQLISVNEIKP